MWDLRHKALNGTEGMASLFCEPWLIATLRRSPSNRLAQLHEICKMGEVMLDMLLGNMKLDVGRFRDVLKA